MSKTEKNEAAKKARKLERAMNALDRGSKRYERNDYGFGLVGHYNKLLK